ncbi:MAG: hypothetical protein A3F68_09020 [Acidobacteria bacterium RIFCSPLOWO2_12_FULL_54_10]|nr:MAG: hypothetical protein A3F68_09020 [Acidobacteria bacterium RIFCSPLOWO2_12_FULL_54_10]
MKNKILMGSLGIVFAIYLLLVPDAAWSQIAFRGRVLDGSGASIPAATVSIYSGDAVAGQAVTATNGEFSLSVAVGEYRIEIAATNFQSYSETIRVSSGMKPLNVTLRLATMQQSVDVQEEPLSIALESDRNIGVLVLDQETIKDLPDDEQELADILRELAGPGAGGEAEIVVDGFTGQNAPPKDQIQEIRINSSPFSAEYSRPGRNRIEIVTRPGTGLLRGNLAFNLRDESLDARRAMANFKPPYQQRNFRSNFSGPLLKDKLSFSLFLMRSDQENSDTIQALTPEGEALSQSVVIPADRRMYNVRLQYMISDRHTLDLSSEFGSNVRKNQGVGGFTLPERASESSSRDGEYRIRETTVLSSGTLHETRFQYSRDSSSSNPLTDARAINVLDAFRSGGAQNRANQTTNSYQFGNLLTNSREKLTLRAGFQGNYQQRSTRSEENFLGTFVFSDLASYLAGKPTTFTINSGNPVLDFNQFEMGLFVQNDWRVTQKWMLSFGLRYEAQTNSGDKNNLDPRVSFAYSLGNGTVLRGGAGMFHQRLEGGTVESLMRLDGTRQLQTVISSPSYPDPFAGTGGQSTIPSSLRVRADDLAQPYTVNSSLSLESRLSAATTISATYELIRGIHLLRSRNLNAPLPGQTVRPDPLRGNIELLESTATSTSHALHLRLNQRFGPMSFFGNYSLSSNHNNTDGPFSLPASNYDLRSEWGRSPNDQRHRFSMGLTSRLPWNISSNLRAQANSGGPFNITTGFDDNGDTLTNDRPAGFSRNSGQGPGFFDMDLSFTKTIPLRRTQESSAGRGGSQNPQAGGFGGGQSFQGGPGFQGGGGFPGGGPGFPGGGGGGGRSSGPTVAITANINNLLNHTNFTRFNGVLTSSFFGRANSVRNPREIEVGLRFNF